MNAADVCREKGWGVGTVLAEPRYITRITAIGEQAVMVRELGYKLPYKDSVWEQLNEPERAWHTFPDPESMQPITALPWQEKEAAP